MNLSGKIGERNRFAVAGYHAVVCYAFININLQGYGCPCLEIIKGKYKSVRKKW